MPLPEAVAGRRVVGARPVAGGDLAAAFRVELDDGTSCFVKTREGADAAEWRREAAGLGWLDEAQAIRVPEVLGVGASWLALAWVDAAGPPSPEALGEQLAALHGAGAEGFGAPWSYGFGDVRLPNEPAPSWAAFVAAQRLRPLARRALDAEGIALIDRVCDRLPGLLPDEPPARLHGDLWSGNVLGDASGAPWLIDPAAHGGHREVDLAMLALFGFPGLDRVLAAYDEAAPLAPGFAERVALHQLTPLLVHAVLFGGGYGARATAIAARY